MSNFQITPLKREDFSGLFGLLDPELKSIGAMKMLADKKPGFPCRVSLQDAEIGEEVILFPYQHHVTDSPYRATGAVFVRKVAETVVMPQNEIPEMLKTRLLSVRAYDSDGMMQKAVVITGDVLKQELQTVFEDLRIAYIHLHNAREGCFHCSVLRC